MHAVLRAIRLLWPLLVTVHGTNSFAAAKGEHASSFKFEACQSKPNVLFVLDPNGSICWENVAIDAFTNATLLPWLHVQHDALTVAGTGFDSGATGLQVCTAITIGSM